MTDGFNLRDLQDELRPWQAHNFPGSPSWQSFVGISEEVGELGHAFLKKAQNIRGTAEEHNAAMVDAVADIIVYIADFCNKEDIDLQAAIEKTWGEVKLRKWRRTTDEWLCDPKYDGLRIVDADGWDRSSQEAFKASWDENITENEFRKRVWASTVHPGEAMLKFLEEEKS